MAGRDMDWQPFGRKSYDLIHTPYHQFPKITILEGSVRSAKTVTMVPLALKMFRAAPPGIIALTGVSKQTIRRNYLDDLFDLVGRNNSSLNQQTGAGHVYGRKIQIVGAKDEGSEKYIRGITLAGAISDELTLTPASFTTQLVLRLSPDGSKLYATTNTDSPYHYVYTDYVGNKEAQDAGRVKIVHYDLDDNPTLSGDYKEFIKAQYSGLFYRRFILGQWCMAEGAIYDMYDPDIHRCTEADIPPSNTWADHLLGVDYGAGNPTSAHHIIVTKRRDGTPDFWVVGEYYYDPSITGQNKTNMQLKQGLIDKYPDIAVHKVRVDPSALGFITELRSTSCGISLLGPVRGANNDVLDGINTVSTHLEQKRIHVLYPECQHLDKQFMSYSWDEKAQKRGEDAPLKENDHAVDDVRYALHSEYPSVTRRQSYLVA